jgi:poly(A) polymerase
MHDHPEDTAAPETEESREETETEGEELDEETDGEEPEVDALELAADLPPEVLAPETPPPPEAPPDSELEPEPEIDPAELLAEAAATGERPEIDPTQLDPDALKVVHRLRKFGYEAYFVGGCVRDLLLGRKPKDFDLATSAHPGEVKSIFRNCRLIGRRFRLAHVYFKGGKICEVATFRAMPIAAEEAPAGEATEAPAEAPADDDLLISDDNVFGTAEQDARRRDFTINGLFYDVASGKVLDYVRGRRDLDERFIRTIGDPEIRMREDPVRILRAVRFACRLGFDIESRTYAAMEGAVEDLPRCAPPRLLEDTFRILRGGCSKGGIQLLAALDALKILLPPVDSFFQQQGKAGEESFYRYAAALDRRIAEQGAPEDAVLLAALLVPIARTAPEEIEDGRPKVAQPIEDLLNELVRSARLPKRIAERCRMILFAQKTLSGERRRRGSLASFRRHPLFNEALAVFEMHVEASGEGQEALEAWKSGAAPQAGPAAPGEGGPRKRRRRRRRRGGGGQGDQAGGEGGGSSDAAPPASNGGGTHDA